MATAAERAAVKQKRAALLARHARERTAQSAKHFAELKAFDATAAAKRAAAEEKRDREDKTTRAGSVCKACDKAVGSNFEYCMTPGCDEIYCDREECINDDDIDGKRCNKWFLRDCTICCKRSCHEHWGDYCYDCDKYCDVYTCCELRNGRCEEHWEYAQEKEHDRRSQSMYFQSMKRPKYGDY
jgi:hypothetical protein